MSAYGKVAIVIGSRSDYDVAKPAVTVLDRFGVESEIRIISAHRSPMEAHDFAVSAEERGFEVLIGVAGKAAHLAGVLAGYPVVDVKVTLYDGSYHEVDSSELAFKIAGSMAFKEACQKADPVILEPIMKVCIIVPDEYMGDVIGDLNSRRGMILGMDAIPGAQQVNAEVPLSEMFGYATDMRSKTQGRGQYTMEPAHYAEVPKNISEKIISERGKKSE